MTASTAASSSGRWRCSPAALFALVIGALSLRTRGVSFIMITLAFAQMVYYVGVSLDRYGGDDGLTIYKRSEFAGLIDLSNKTVVLLPVLRRCCWPVYLVWRLVNSRFGMVIRGARSNERRMRAIGFPTFRYKLAGFVIAGVMCGLAGIAARQPDRLRQPRDDALDALRRLIVMVVLGGMGTLLGPVIGAVALLLLEEALPHLIAVVGQFITGTRCVAAKEYWALILGPMLLLVVLFARGGIDGLLARIAP